MSLSGMPSAFARAISFEALPARSCWAAEAVFSLDSTPTYTITRSGLLATIASPLVTTPGARVGVLATLADGGARWDRLVDRDRRHPQALPEDHAWPLDEVDVRGRKQVRVASPRRLIAADRLVFGQHPLDDHVRLHTGDQRLGGGEGRVKGRLPHHAPKEGDGETAHGRRRREKEIGSEVET